VRKSVIFALVIIVCLALVLFSIVYFKELDVAVLNGAGRIALQQGRLLITATLMMLIVVIPALVLALIFAWRYGRGKGQSAYDPEWEHSVVGESIWWGVPCLIIVVLAVLTYRASYHLDPFRPLESATPPMTIQVVALDWKWLFLYPEQKIASVNFLQIPTHTPINFEITADAPMNSFWVPQLGGQIFAMPAMRTKLQLIAERAGDYRGSSANISGRGFAGMAFITRAGSVADFEAWVDSARASSRGLTFEEYRQLARPSEYHPVTTYRLEAEGLFNWILMKYMMPAAEN
jgi:cytochrome o ubiquinol oxidase subunit II